MLVSVVKLALRRRNRRGVHSMTLPDPSKTAADQAKRNAQQTQKQYRFSWSSDSFDRLDRRCARERRATATTTNRTRLERWRSARACAHRSAAVPGGAPYSRGPHRRHQYRRVVGRPVRHRAQCCRSGEDGSEHPVERSSSLGTELQDRPVAEKQDWNRIGGQWTLRFGKKLSFPAGINSGQQLALMLSRETIAYSGVQSFDELPIHSAVSQRIFERAMPLYCRKVPYPRLCGPRYPFR